MWNKNYYIKINHFPCTIQNTDNTSKIGKDRGIREATKGYVSIERVHIPKNLDVGPF